MNKTIAKKKPSFKCKTCGKIPTSAAQTREGSDYTYHFCSKDCEQKWFKHI